MFASNEVMEQYSLVHKKELYGSRYSIDSPRLEKIAYIDLEDDKYSEYKWFRMFFDFESMRKKREITYTFGDGFFGIRVMKDYEFSR